jgi:NAD-dependent SIR2 family protein deacetylase
MKTAIFLGAGASKAFGYPLTFELLPRIVERLSKGILFNSANPPAENRRDRKWFGERLYSFLPGLADAIKDIPKNKGELGVGVTDLLTLIDRALLHTESRTDIKPEEFGRFRRLLERAIYEALLRNNARQEKAAQEVRANFVKWIKSISPEVSIVTTNYDTAIDWKLHRAVAGPSPGQSSSKVAAGIDFGFSWRLVDSGKLVPRPPKPKWRILKLHGSVNWLQCSLCGQIYINTESTVGSKAFATKLDEWNTCHCNNEEVRLRLHLVTPSFIRQTNDAQLLELWLAALEALRTADHWIIAGYSLPAEDIAIRSLFLRAWDGHKRRSKPQVTVIQRDDQRVRGIYEVFFPKARLRYWNQGLATYLENCLKKP